MQTPDGHTIIGAVWFTPRTGECIGIVTIRDKWTNEKKSYIGIGLGESEEKDIIRIYLNGAKFIF